MTILMNFGATMTNSKPADKLFSKKIKIIVIAGIILLLLISIVYNLTKETPSQIITPAPENTSFQEL
jgi:hypothetical protein